MKRNPKEVEALYQEMLIHVTGFFREPETFDVLQTTVLPRLLERRGRNDPIRVWLPGCSTGEEAYSLAIIMTEFFDNRAESLGIQIFATDVSERVLEIARKGVFDTLIGLNDRDVVRRSFLEIGLRVLKEGKDTPVEELWSGDANQDIECSLVTPHHGTIDVLATTRVMVFRGEPCVLLMVQDLSDLKRLKHDLIEISEEERRRFGRDLHDSHCQDLTAIVFYAETIAATLADKDVEIARQIRNLAGMVRRSAESAHRLAAGLGGSVVQQRGLSHALEEVASYARERYGVECSMTIKGIKAIQKTAVATHLYRITQEAISNAARHGQAKKIAISLMVEGDQGILKISDDGQGISSTGKSKGLGLRTMRYRAAELKGALRIDSQPGSGTIIVCSFPTQQ